MKYETPKIIELGSIADLTGNGNGNGPPPWAGGGKPPGNGNGPPPWAGGGGIS